MFEWIESLFSNKHIPHSMLVIDVGTSSVSGALVTREHDGRLDVRKVFRHPISLIDTDNEERIAHVLLASVKKIFSSAHSLFPKIDQVRFAFSDPFFVLENISRLVDHRPPGATITKHEIENLFKKCKIEHESNHTHFNSIGSSIISSTVNGYPVSDLTNYKGEQFEISFICTLISKELVSQIKATVHEIYPHADLQFYSDIEVIRSLLILINPAIDPTLIIDMGGEITSLSMVGKNLVLHNDPVLLGVNTAGRRLAAATGKTPKEGGSLLRAYSDGSFSESKSIEATRILENFLEDLWSEINMRIENFDEHPLQVVFTGGGSDLKFLRKAITEKVNTLFGANYKVNFFTASDSDKFFITKSNLSGGVDAVLAALSVLE